MNLSFTSSVRGYLKALEMWDVASKMLNFPSTFYFINLNVLQSTSTLLRRESLHCHLLSLANLIRFNNALTLMFFVELSVELDHIWNIYLY